MTCSMAFYGHLWGFNEEVLAEASEAEKKAEEAPSEEWENHEKSMGKWWLMVVEWDFMGLTLLLCQNNYIERYTIFQWENPENEGSFSTAMSNCWRVNMDLFFGGVVKLPWNFNITERFKCSILWGKRSLDHGCRSPR